MIKCIVTDFSRVLLFPANESYKGGLNELNNQLLQADPNYDFWQHFRINNELIDYYKSLDIPVYIFTSETVQEHPAIKDKLHSVFTDVFSAKHLKVSKKDADTYLVIASKLNLQPGEILYIDDNYSNIQAAATAGCETILYTSTAAAIDKIKELCTNSIQTKSDNCSETL